MKRLAVASVLIFLGCCAPALAQPAADAPIAPAEAIQQAAAAAPGGGVEGTFVLTVRASGVDKRRRTVYLNSELDYRDQRNVTVDLEPPAFAGLQARYGKDLEKAFIGKQILVTGTARRVTIYFGTLRFSKVTGKPLNKYYFQTHVRVLDADQVTEVPPSPFGAAATGGRLPGL